MTKKHISQSGATEGQWVTCSAQISCRNGGMHVDSDDLNKTQVWLKHNSIIKPANQLAPQDIINWKRSGFDGTPEAIQKLKKSLAPKTTSKFNQIRSTEENWNKVKELAEELGAEVHGIKIYDTSTGQLYGVKDIEIEGVQYDVMRLNALIDSNSQKSF